MKAAIIYCSLTGNTFDLVQTIAHKFSEKGIQLDPSPISSFPLNTLQDFDLIVVGTYTWGNGEIPKEMLPLYHTFETQQTKHIVTGVCGTGDTFYPHYCGAVDKFRDMLYAQTDLAVTLKVELLPKETDIHRCEQFVDKLLQRYAKKQTPYPFIVHK